MSEEERRVSEWLNENCHCVSLDSDQLALELADLDLPEEMFSRYPVFISAGEFAAMRRCIEAVEETVRLPAYRERVLETSSALARVDPGARGVFFGYDFHLGSDGPRLIEVNTNAGGALLNLAAARAQRACCSPCEPVFPPTAPLPDLEARIVAMFQSEWRAAGRSGALESIAIVDEAPRDQYMYPEFRLFQKLLRDAGITSAIAAPEELRFSEGQLQLEGQRVDLVYNRLTDFYLEAEASRALRAAYEANAAVVTPHPRAHALLARKSNLALLSDAEALGAMGVPSSRVATLLEAIPETLVVTGENADALWSQRKRYYFKPIDGFGSRATYAGSKLTKKTWEHILQGGYVAQRLVTPSRRKMGDGESPESLKVDVRHYTYAGETQLIAARLYRGQTTNFRTAGGGFAPVLVPFGGPEDERPAP